MTTTNQLLDPIGDWIIKTVEKIRPAIWVVIVIAWCVANHYMALWRYPGGKIDISLPSDLSGSLFPLIMLGSLVIFFGDFLEKLSEKFYDNRSCKTKIIVLFIMTTVAAVLIYILQVKIFYNPNLTDFSSSVSSTVQVGSTTYRRASGAGIESGGDDAYLLLAGNSMQIFLFFFGLYWTYLAIYNFFYKIAKDKH